MNINCLKFIWAAAVVSAALSGCSGKGQSGNPSGQAHSVLTTRPAPVQGSGDVSCSGIVKEAHNVNVGFKTPGQIVAVNVKAGDYVREGQLIARLDDADYKLGVEALQIQYDQISGEVSRIRELYGKKSVSANDYEKAKAGLEQLGIQLQVNRNKLGYTKLYAPVSGYVQEVNFSKAEMVDAGTPVFVIMDVSHRQVETDIPAAEYRSREHFSGISCISPAGETARMRVEGIVPKADGNQLYRMTLAFDGKAPESFVPGTNVEVKISRDTGEQRPYALPVNAIVYDGNGSAVFTVNRDSTVSRKPVKVGKLYGNMVEVSGLSEDDLVVKAGASALLDGEKVKVIPNPSAANAGGLL